MLLRNVSLCQVTTLTIRIPLSLSLPAQDLPLSQIFATIDYSGLRTDSTDFMTGPVRLSVAVFVFSFFIKSTLFVFCFGSMWQIKLATRQLLGARKYSVAHRIASYLRQTLQWCVTRPAQTCCRKMYKIT